MAAKKNKKIVQSEKCIGCGVCVSVCPINTKLEKKEDFEPEKAELAIRVVNGKAVIEEEFCIRCGACARICPVESLSVVELESKAEATAA
ncbi:MAG: 4Fe-4S dicluster domain-containing protein [Methanosarcinaceae archaeon]|nr:4Fe-4S dicluster domain-containing protein [Methanosarcinaceae archaeon]MDD4330758.1 4Fe-4S dicluster domain-containing protein [Methanosarcinaceae archaeon]MDD4749537.1 4Fe-4S dicluster domain-containing protein [Methanosarcinaceae archaeon]